MNEKQRFLDELSAALSERGISDTDIAPYIEQFDRFYDRMRTDDVQTSSVLTDVETIADNIAAQVSDKYDAINRLAEKTMTVDAVSDIDIDEGVNEDENLDFPTAEADIVDIYEDDDEYEVVEEFIDETDEPPLIPADLLDDIESEYSQSEQEFDEPKRLPDYVPEEEIPNSKMFWILFGVSLPITLPLALAAVSVFAAAWAALIALIVGAVAALTAIVAVGTGLSLIGIIYGAVKLFSDVPAGLYEIGLGVIVAGLVMFFGILLYNFAVRLVPLLIKQVWKLFKYLLGRLKHLFNYLRRESAKL
ncbi:MAG: hypothetical protein IJY93_03120 [Clostridia bacterium]|nr:hypothetical protein [Clostridia bacterium]